MAGPVSSSFNLSPVFFDCEASSLDGYIIEIGWAFLADDGDIESAAHLVRPPWNWKIRDAWSAKSEKLHGVSLDHLRAHGERPDDVARIMNSALARRELFSDSPYDEAWLRQLFEAAGMEPTFTIRRTLAPALVEQTALDRGFDLARLRDAQIQAELNRRHRAEEDALLWARLWRMVVSND